MESKALAAQPVTCFAHILCVTKVPLSPFLLNFRIIGVGEGGKFGLPVVGEWGEGVVEGVLAGRKKEIKDLAKVQYLAVGSCLPQSWEAGDRR